MRSNIAIKHRKKMEIRGGLQFELKKKSKQ